jgi:hypothetical protein
MISMRWSFPIGPNGPLDFIPPIPAFEFFPISKTAPHPWWSVFIVSGGEGGRNPLVPDCMTQSAVEKEEINSLGICVFGGEDWLGHEKETKDHTTSRPGKLEES